MHKKKVMLSLFSCRLKIIIIKKSQYDQFWKQAGSFLVCGLCLYYDKTRPRPTFPFALGPEARQFFFALFAAKHAQIVKPSLNCLDCVMLRKCAMESYWTPSGLLWLVDPAPQPELHG